MTNTEPFRLVIHRDRTFEYDGKRYYVGQEAERWGDLPFRIERIMSDAPGDWIEVADGFRTLGDIRRFVARCHEHGWPLEDESVTREVEVRQRELRVDASSARI